MRRTALFLAVVAIVAALLLWRREAAGPANAPPAPNANGPAAPAEAAPAGAPVGGPGGEPAGGAAEEQPQRATAGSAEPAPSPEAVQGDRVVVRVPGAFGAEITAFLAQCDNPGRIRPGAKRSEPFRLTVGATLSIVPVWKR